MHIISCIKAILKYFSNGILCSLSEIVNRSFSGRGLANKNSSLWSWVKIAVSITFFILYIGFGAVQGASLNHTTSRALAGAKETRKPSIRPVPRPVFAYASKNPAKLGTTKPGPRPVFTYPSKPPKTKKPTLRPVKKPTKKPTVRRIKTPSKKL